MSGQHRPLPTAQEGRVDATRILAYWFGDLDDKAIIDMKSAQCRKWYAQDAGTDAEIRTLFLDQYRIAQNALLDWEKFTPRDCLALVILFDQFSRNMFRNDPATYGTDARAVELCLGGLDRCFEQHMPLIHRMFLFMPLMHSEDLSRQRQTVGLFSALLELAKVASPQNVGFFEMALGYAQRHCSIVERFGRFPHRNAILGRASTKDELEFLKQPDSAF